MPAASTEPATAAAVAAPRAARSQRRPSSAPAAGDDRPPVLARGAMWWPTLLFAGVLCFITFYAKGGLNLESMTTTEVVLTLGSGVLVASAAMLARTATRTYGLAALALMLAFTMLTAVSIVWSVRPDDSWQEAGRLLAYTGVFAAGSALVRIAPERWPALLGAIVLAAVIVCGYALTTKVFPGTFATTNTFARLEEPYGYWNAIGLTAALGVVACMWLGARRSGHALLRALAYPAMGLLALTLALAYSRGALVALALSLALWFCLVPRRLRAVALLVAGALGAGGVAAWDFSTHALSSEGIALAQRASAGHRLGALIVAMVALLTAVGVAVGFLSGRRAPSQATRQRAGAAVLAGLLVLALAFAGALAHSQRGLTGSVSHAFHSLTNPNAKPPPNTPGRLTAVASVRARYWKEALQIFDAHPALGAGAGGYDTARLRYRTETLEVRHAHGFVVQTLADLGVVGLALALALLVAWMAAAGTATHPFNRSWTSWRSWRDMRTGARPGWRRLTDRRLTSYTPERVGLLTMLCIVVCFGVHSLIDWTWYVPGNACVALLCAGWLAGRGPLTPTTGAAEHAVHPGATTQADGVGAEQAAGVSAEPASAGPRGAWSEQPRNVRIALAAAAIVAALLAVWSQLQPQRAEESRQQALALLASNPAAASAAAHRAVDRDPLSSEALFTLANVQQVTGHPTLARATLVRAVRKQPSNPQTWLVLGRYDLTRNPQASAKELQAAIFLDPESISPEAIAVGNHEAIEIHNDYIHALSAAVALRSASESRARATAAARRARPRRSARRSTRSGSRPAGR